ncbi:hypothetical protein C8D91_1401 [Marinicella litoralis]|uniref:Uncharacterized protein n=2 Tax=Marinicella litoralis TaxID=644220 RepID=A0A4R6XPU7_9GAMM|nr:hypothetical protein C8D91_1401 [Marinicella litoralis]
MGLSQPEMRNMNNFKPPKTHLLGLVVCATAINPAQAVTPVLDGYAYIINSTVVIDFDNQIINFDSNMNNCQQANGQPPIDTSVIALTSNQEIIGLNSMTYNVKQGVIYFFSETSDIICSNGIYVDTLFEEGFD